LLESILGPGVEWTSGEGHQYLLFPEEDFRGDTMLTVDQLGVGRLRAPYADELVLAWETQVAAQTSVELSWVHKRTRDLIEDTCSNNQWIWGDGPDPDLDDSSTWPDWTQCEAWVFANIPDLERNYKAWILRLEARRERFHLLASYTLSDSRGNVVTGPSGYAPLGTWDYYPTHWVNQYGRQGDHRRHRVKVNGFLRLPWDLDLGVDGFWSSEGHQTVWASCSSFAAALSNPNAVEQMNQLGIDPEQFRYCYDGAGHFSGNLGLELRPRGDLRTKSTWQVNVQLSKAFRIRKVELEGILAVYNLFDRELDDTFNSQAFLQATDDEGNAVFDDNGNAMYVPVGAPTGYREPRRYELGLRFEF
jgi:hypothetical protein